MEHDEGRAAFVFRVHEDDAEAVLSAVMERGGAISALRWEGGVCTLGVHGCSQSDIAGGSACVAAYRDGMAEFDSAPAIGMSREDCAALPGRGGLSGVRADGGACAGAAGTRADCGRCADCAGLAGNCALPDSAWRFLSGIRNAVRACGGVPVYGIGARGVIDVCVAASTAALPAVLRAAAECALGGGFAERALLLCAGAGQCTVQLSFVSSPHSFSVRTPALVVSRFAPLFAGAQGGMLSVVRPQPAARAVFPVLDTPPVRADGRTRGGDIRRLGALFAGFGQRRAAGMASGAEGAGV